MSEGMNGLQSTQVSGAKAEGGNEQIASMVPRWQLLYCTVKTTQLWHTDAAQTSNAHFISALRLCPMETAVT